MVITITGTVCAIKGPSANYRRRLETYFKAVINGLENNQERLFCKLRNCWFPLLRRIDKTVYTFTNGTESPGLFGQKT